MPPMSGPPEQMKPPIGNIRKALDALKAAIKKNVPSEDDAAKHARIEAHIIPLADAAQKFREAREDFKVANPGFDATPEYQKLVEIDKALVEETLNPTTVEMTELITGITEGALNPADPNILKDLTAEHIEDEEALLQSTLTIYDKAVEGVTKLYEKLSQKFRDNLDAIGINAGVFANMIIGALAGFIDRGPFRGLAKNLRAGAAIRQASAEGISQAAIVEGQRKWEPEYAAWMQRTAQNPTSNEPPPDLYVFIQNEQDNALAQQRLDDLKAKFDPANPDLFGAGSGPNIELKLSGSPTVIKGGGTWNITLPHADVEMDDSVVPTAFSLRTGSESEKLKELYENIQVAALANPDISEIRRGAFEITGGVLTAEIDGNLTEPRLKSALHLSPTGATRSVQLLTGSLLMDTVGTGKFESAVLYVNYSALDRNSTELADLQSKAEADPAREWKWNGSAWTV